jgi:nitrite reductase/ring-hydroxylating ferredoxin subunit
METSRTFLLALLLYLVVGAEAWTAVLAPINNRNTQTRRTTELFMAKARRGRLAKEVGGGGVEGGMSGVSGGGGAVNWIAIAADAKDLPSTENRVGLVDTNLPALKNAQTNPTGAVSVIKYKGQMYCFAVNCPSCKIPLTKAQAVTQDGRSCLVCDFCKATYDLKTGSKVESKQKTGLLGGIAKSVFSAQDSGPLTTFKLGEKNGKLLIALD